MTAALYLGKVAPDNTPLPQLQDALLDPDTLEQLVQDIQRCTVVKDVLLKGGALMMASERSVPLTEAAEALRQGRVLGVQIRYWYEGADWWDTLMRTPKGIRLIRIENRLQG
ncbi:hypothetical protein [Archangium sp.]|jgi:hypothetical protein|uniref:hypothetical protein n=1 Tax=Archangium sp. TaxID=1872627 RepID=UPI002EDA5966